MQVGQLVINYEEKEEYCMDDEKEEIIEDVDIQSLRNYEDEEVQE
jgi:hypothetical protein